MISGKDVNLQPELSRTGTNPQHGPAPCRDLCPASKQRGVKTGANTARTESLNLTHLESTVHRGSNSGPSLAKTSSLLHRNTLIQLLSVYKRPSLRQNGVTDVNNKWPSPRSFPVSEELRNVERVIV